MWVNKFIYHLLVGRGRHGRDLMVVGFTTTYAINAYCEYEPPSWRGLLDSRLCDTVC